MAWPMRAGIHRFMPLNGWGGNPLIIVNFTNKRGMSAGDNIWIMAVDEHAKAYQWHFKYFLPTTKVLGKLACLVLSKILGIGTAERNWKQVKAVKSSQRVNTGID